MNRKSKEVLKTIVLVVLIITSLLQVGILWTYQSHGFPTNFLSVFFPKGSNTPQEMDELAREEYFRPFRIVAYRDEDSRVLLDSGNVYYDDIWNEGQEYIKQALYNQNLIPLSYSYWNELITRRCFVIEFKSPMPSDLIKWFLNIQTNEDPKVENIYKILIAPGDSGNKNYNTVYIRGSRTLHKMIVPFWSQGLLWSGYENAFNSLKDNKTNIYNPFYVTGFTFDIPADTLCVIGSEANQQKRFNTLRYSIPDEIADNDLLTRILLDNKKESYDRTEDLQGTVIFQNLRNIYKIYSHGLLEHRYIPATPNSDKGTISEAFIQVHRFIRDIKDVLLPNSSIFIYSAEDAGNMYKFELGYIANGKPIYIQTENGAENAIVITANSKRVLSCKWILRDVQLERMINAYDMNFISLANRLVDTYGNVIPELSIKDIMEGYLLKPDKNNNIEPVWLIDTSNRGVYSVPMERGEGF